MHLKYLTEPAILIQNYRISTVCLQISIKEAVKIVTQNVYGFLMTTMSNNTIKIKIAKTKLLCDFYLFKKQT